MLVSKATMLGDVFPLSRTAGDKVVAGRAVFEGAEGSHCSAEVLQSLCPPSSSMDELEARLFNRQHILTRCLRRWIDEQSRAAEERRHRLLVAENFYGHRLCFTLFRAWQWRFRALVLHCKLEAIAAAAAARRCTSCRSFPLAVSCFRRWRAITNTSSGVMKRLCEIQQTAARLLMHRYFKNDDASSAERLHVKGELREKKKKNDDDDLLSCRLISSWAGRAMFAVFRQRVQKDASSSMQIKYVSQWRRWSCRRARARLASTCLRQHVEADAMLRVWYWWILSACRSRALRNERHMRAVEAISSRRDDAHRRARFLAWGSGGGRRHRGQGLPNMALEPTSDDARGISISAVTVMFGGRGTGWGRTCGFVELQRLMRKVKSSLIRRRFDVWTMWRVCRKQEHTNVLQADGHRRVHLVQLVRRRIKLLDDARERLRLADHFFITITRRRMYVGYSFARWKAGACLRRRDRELTAKASAVGLALRSHLAMRRLVDCLSPSSSTSPIAGAGAYRGGGENTTTTDPSQIGPERERHDDLLATSLWPPRAQRVDREGEDHAADGERRRSRSSSLSSLLGDVRPVPPPLHFTAAQPHRPSPRSASPATDRSHHQHESIEDGKVKKLATRTMARRPQPIPIHSGAKAAISVMTTLPTMGAQELRFVPSTASVLGDDVVVPAGFSQQKFLSLMSEYKHLRKSRQVDLERILAIRTAMATSIAADDEDCRRMVEELAALRDRQQHMLTLRSSLQMMMRRLNEAIVNGHEEDEDT